MDDQEIMVEMCMWNLDKTILKSFLWSTFVHFNLKTQRREKHSADLMNAFLPYSIDLPEAVHFEERLEQIRKPVRI